MAIHLTQIDELALVTLDRPKVLNALNSALLRDLGVVLDQIASGDARALLITGSGDRAFCAGADVKELMGRALVATRGGAAALGTMWSPCQSADHFADGEVEVTGAMSRMDRGYPAGAPGR